LPPVTALRFSTPSTPERDGAHGSEGRSGARTWVMRSPPWLEGVCSAFLSRRSHSPSPGGRTAAPTPGSTARPVASSTQQGAARTARASLGDDPSRSQGEPGWRNPCRRTMVRSCGYGSPDRMTLELNRASPARMAARAFALVALFLPIALPLAIVYARRAREEAAPMTSEYSWLMRLIDRPVVSSSSCWRPSSRSCSSSWVS
jgi:hypothetical protein